MLDVTCVALCKSDIFRDGSLLNKGSVDKWRWRVHCCKHQHVVSKHRQVNNVIEWGKRVLFWKELTCWLLIRCLGQGREFQYLDTPTFWTPPSLYWFFSHWKNQLFPSSTDWWRVIRGVIMKYSRMEGHRRVQILYYCLQRMLQVKLFLSMVLFVFMFAKLRSSISLY